MKSHKVSKEHENISELNSIGIKRKMRINPMDGEYIDTKLQYALFSLYSF